MAVTLTRAQLAVELRIAVTESETLQEGISAILDRSLAVGAAQVLAYAPNAPDAVHNASAVRIAGWLFEAELAGRQRHAAPMLSTGAAALLSQFREERLYSGDGAPSANAVVALLADALIGGTHVNIRRVGDTFVIDATSEVSTTDQVARSAATAAQAAADEADAAAGTAQATADAASTAASGAYTAAGAAQTTADAASSAASANRNAIAGLPRLTVSGENPNTQSPPGHRRTGDVHVQVDGARLRIFRLDGAWNVDAAYTGAQSWALVDDTSTIPVAKLPAIPVANLPADSLLPSPADLADDQVLKVSSGAWVVGRGGSGWTTVGDFTTPNDITSAFGNFWDTGLLIPAETSAMWFVTTSLANSHPADPVINFTLPFDQISLKFIPTSAVGQYTDSFYPCLSRGLSTVSGGMSASTSSVVRIHFGRTLQRHLLFAKSVAVRAVDMTIRVYAQ